MPLTNYFKGKGPEVMKAMMKEYGEKKGKSVFYATANKQKGLAAHMNAMKVSRKLKSKAMK